MQSDKKRPSFDVMRLLTQHSTRWVVSKYKENQILYAQGDRADSVFYIHTGKVKVTVISERGKGAIVAIRGPDDFCGEGALTGRPLRLATVTTMSACEIVRLEKQASPKSEICLLLPFATKNPRCTFEPLTCAACAARRQCGAN
jgi:CRP/FNR family transcriptional regulator, cyclic AMP receptor protein